eukprot:scaffold59515_cov63-Cyclotella_meneghiniana.AAC.2
MTQKKIDSLNEIGFVWVARHLDDNDGNNDDDSTENEFNERTPRVKYYLMTGGEYDDMKNEDTEDDKNVDVVAQIG